MYLTFAWRYFKAKKSANAINIIAWVTTCVIAFATCCQILVLSVFNGFEDLVQSLYASFYTDMKIIPVTGKTFILDQTKFKKLKSITNIDCASLLVEEKALLQNGELQSVVQLKGVDSCFKKVTNIESKIIRGSFDLGTVENPTIVIGAGIQNATGIQLDSTLEPEILTLLSPKKDAVSSDVTNAISETTIRPSGSFSIQQDFDNTYAITNVELLKQLSGFSENEFSAIEIKLKKTEEQKATQVAIQQIMGSKFKVLTRYEQNESLYRTMKTEKWAIFAILTLILIIAAFNMISALSMLVLEKKMDIAILKSMGATKRMTTKIFLTEGLLLGLIGTLTGVGFSLLICYVQMKYKLIKLQGGTFLIDYFPIKIVGIDVLLVVFTSIVITLVASWIPSVKGSKEVLQLR